MRNARHARTTPQVSQYHSGKPSHRCSIRLWQIIRWALHLSPKFICKGNSPHLAYPEVWKPDEKMKLHVKLRRYLSFWVKLSCNYKHVYFLNAPRSPRLRSTSRDLRKRKQIIKHFMCDKPELQKVSWYWFVRLSKTIQLCWFSENQSLKSDWILHFLKRVLTA